MKHILRTYLPMAAIILTAALGSTAAAQTQVPLKGTFQGSDSVTPPATMVVTATGTATQLGKLTLQQEVTLNFETLTDAGNAEWVAANGDKIYTTVAGSAIPGELAYNITEIHTITGGTGRFAGAQGSFTVHRIHVVTPGEDGSHITFGWFEGTMTSPGATH